MRCTFVMRDNWNKIVEIIFRGEVLYGTGIWVGRKCS